MFSDVMKVTVVKDAQGKPTEVRLSIRVTDTQVEVHSFTPQTFAIMVAEYKAELEN